MENFENMPNPEIENLKKRLLALYKKFKIERVELNLGNSEFMQKASQVNSPEWLMVKLSVADEMVENAETGDPEAITQADEILKEWEEYEI